MSKTDKSKIDGIAVGANNYTHPVTHLASNILQDANNRFTSDLEKLTWNNHVNSRSNPHGITSAQIGAATTSEVTDIKKLSVMANKMLQPLSLQRDSQRRRMQHLILWLPI